LIKNLESIKEDINKAQTKVKELESIQVSFGSDDFINR
jgi:hypothetical protein